MPLTRLSEGFQVDLEGVAFGMLDGQHTVRCFVTYDAITDAMRGNQTQDERVQWFIDNRSFVEEVASDMYHGGAESHPQLRVGSQDLNPHLFP